MSKNPHSLVPKFNNRTCQTLLSTPPLGTCDNLKCGKSATWELLFIQNTHTKMAVLKNFDSFNK